MLGDNMTGLTVELAVSRTVRDTAAILDAVEGPAPGDPYHAPPPERPYIEELEAGRKFRIGVQSDPPVPGLDSDPECVAAVDTARKLLESLGHTVEDSSPVDPQLAETLDLEDSFMTRWAAGQAATLDQLAMLVGRPITADDVEPLTWALAEIGRERSSARYLTDHGLHQLVGRGIAGWFEGGYDLLLTPTMAEPPVPLGTYDQSRARPARRLPPGDPGGRVHGDLQRHRSAGDLAAPALDRGRPAGRNPAGGAVRSRGSADRRRRPARAGATVVRAHAPRVRRQLSRAARWRIPSLPAARSPASARSISVTLHDRDPWSAHRDGDAVRPRWGRRLRRRPGAGAPADRQRLPRSRDRRDHGRVADAHRRREGAAARRRPRRDRRQRDRDRGHGHERHRPCGGPDPEGARGRRPRRARGDAVLQQAQRGRHTRPLRGGLRGGRRDPDRALQHPLALRDQHRPRAARRARRGAREHRRRQAGKQRRARPDRGDRGPRRQRRGLRPHAGLRRPGRDPRRLARGRAADARALRGGDRRRLRPRGADRRASWHRSTRR